MKRKTAVCIMCLLVVGFIFMGGCSTETDIETSKAVPSETETETTTAQVTAPETKTESAVPQLVIPESTFEFGPVLEDKTVVHKFIVQNKGTAELAITKVKSG